MFTIEKFKDAYKIRDDIYSRMKELSGDNYSLAKQAFFKSIEEFDRLDKILNNSDLIVNGKKSGNSLVISSLHDYVDTFRKQLKNATP